MKRLRSLNTQHKAAARLKAEGGSLSQISEALGVQMRTLHVWFSDDLVKAEVARLVERIEDVFVERKSAIGLRALDELSRFSDMPATRLQTSAECKTCGYIGSATAPHGTADPKCDGPWRVTEREFIGENTKLDAIREILDRVDATTTLRDRARAQEAVNGGGGDGGNHYVQVFNQMSDADLANVLQRWAGQTPVVNGDGNGTPALPG